MSLVIVIDEDTGERELIERPDFQCERCGENVGATRDSKQTPWKAADCYDCVTLPRLKRDVARRRKLGHVVVGVDLDKAFATYRKVPLFKEALGRRKYTLEVVHRLKGGTRGTAFMRQRRIRLAAGPDATPARVLEVLVHEMTHHACPNHRHDELFRRTLRRAFREVWDLDVPINVEPSLGVIAYGMDNIAERLLATKIAQGDVEIFPPTAPAPKPSRADLMKRVVEARAEHASTMHKKALKKLTQARKSEAKWRKKARYYERQAAKKGAS